MAGVADHHPNHSPLTLLAALLCCDLLCRCADLDCDGVITPSEMWHFYEEQMKRLEGLSQEPVLFEDVLCQLHDMLQVRALWVWLVLAWVVHGRHMTAARRDGWMDGARADGDVSQQAAKCSGEGIGAKHPCTTRQ